MAKRKKAQPWDAVFDRVRVILYADRRYPPPTLDAEVDAVEAQLGFQFPLSYRAFATSFGLGGRLRYFPIELYLLISPEPSEPAFRRDSVVDDALRLRSCLREYFERLERPYPHIEFERVVPFAGDEQFYTYFFHPAEVTDSRGQECRIYRQTWDEGDLTLVADSFPEWLSESDLIFSADSNDEELHGAVYPTVFKQRANRPDFIPYWANNGEATPRICPTEPDVTLWLASNNNTARDLALSIRDRGQTDAFPILADALQEAGCTNADLLDSCRTGDPDIDGKWVLQVLLGKT